MPLAERLVVHTAGPFRQPVINTPHDGEDGARYQHVMEVCNDEIGILVLKISRHDCEHQARETADREQKQEGQREEHWRLERDRPAPHRRAPVEHLNTGWDRDQHR